MRYYDDPEYLDELDDTCECDSPFRPEADYEDLLRDAEWDYVYNDGEWEYYEDIERDYYDIDW